MRKCRGVWCKGVGQGNRPVRRAEMIKPPRTNAVVLVYYERPVKVGVKPKSALTTSKRDKERVTTRT